MKSHIIILGRERLHLENLCLSMTDLRQGNLLKHFGIVSEKFSFKANGAILLSVPEKNGRLTDFSIS